MRDFLQDRARPQHRYGFGLRLGALVAGVAPGSGEGYDQDGGESEDAQDSEAESSPELADDMFDPFVSTKRTGRGLGLAIADKLVRDNGGIIQYAREGTPERTVFRLLLRRAK